MESLCAFEKLYNLLSTCLLVLKIKNPPHVWRGIFMSDMETIDYQTLARMLSARYILSPGLMLKAW